MKRNLPLIIIISSFVIVWTLGCYLSKINLTNAAEEELLKTKALAVTMSIYLRNTDLISIEMESDTQQEINKVIKYLDPNCNLDKAFISSYNEEDNEKIRVIVQLEENPFKTVLFHEMTFQKISGRWILVDFESDV
ncbi:MAG TPA: hypothetical protein GXZ27_07200 [Thermoanaerobacterales bacterium]|nr:hypothetical protein [Thermoanaerobacterales bacterium]